MIKLVVDNYKTYVGSKTGQPERHGWRIAAILFFGLTCALSLTGDIGNIATLIATALTILTGFTFTALFSDHALADAGLPRPKNETDRADLKRLAVLGINFRVRSNYFIALAILNVCVVMVLVLGINFDSAVRLAIHWIQPPLRLDANFTDELLALFGEIASKTLVSFSIIMFLESLYTFYRLTETIFAILDSRKEYLEMDD